MRLLIFGPPGAGKGTYASRLAAKLEAAHISMGDLLREIVKQQKPARLAAEIKSYMEKGQLVPDELAIKVLRKELSRQQRFILEGFPRTIGQVDALKAIATIDAVINLHVPQSVIIKRLSARRQCTKCNAVYNLRSLKPKRAGKCDHCGSALYQRIDDKPAVIKKRLELYKKETEPVLSYLLAQCNARLINIKNSKVDIPPELVVEQILKQLQQLQLTSQKKP